MLPLVILHSQRIIPAHLMALHPPQGSPSSYRVGGALPEKADKTGEDLLALHCDGLTDGKNYTDLCRINHLVISEPFPSCPIRRNSLPAARR